MKYEIKIHLKHITSRNSLSHCFASLEEPFLLPIEFLPLKYCLSAMGTPAFLWFLIPGIWYLLVSQVYLFLCYVLQLGKKFCFMKILVLPLGAPEKEARVEMDVVYYLWWYTQARFCDYHMVQVLFNSALGHRSNNVAKIYFSKFSDNKSEDKFSTYRVAFIFSSYFTHMPI